MAADKNDADMSRGYIDGCWDIMHSGHFNAIRQAKSICDVLVVGIHSDEEIEENKALPVMRQEERYALLEHIKWIDEIIHDVPYSPQLATLEKARADFCVHGDDMPVNSQGVCAYDDMKHAGKLRIVKRTEGVSTTDLIGRLLTLQRPNCEQEEKTMLGKRIHPEDAIERLLKIPKQDVDVNPGHALDQINALVAKYSMTPTDAAVLRGALSSIPSSTESASSSLSCESVRTKAPVQLLASSRRIVEFASSRQPSDGEKLVYVCGSFDMFHVGHTQFLKEARALGSFLLVGIQDDMTVGRSKGHGFPVMNLTERVLNVCACKWVDEVIIGAPRGVTQDLIKNWDIRTVARGSGHLRNTDIEAAVDHYAIAKELGIMVEIPSKWPKLCHDTIVERIVSSREVYLKRNKDRAKREDDYYNQKIQAAVPKES